MSALTSPRILWLLRGRKQLSLTAMPRQADKFEVEKLLSTAVSHDASRLGRISSHAQTDDQAEIHIAAAAQMPRSRKSGLEAVSLPNTVGTEMDYPCESAPACTFEWQGWCDRKAAKGAGSTGMHTGGIESAVFRHGKDMLSMVCT